MCMHSCTYIQICKFLYMYVHMDYSLFLEEERDSLLTKCSRKQTTITELRASLRHEKEGICSVH